MRQIELSNTALSDFFKQLALLMQAGISLSDGLLLLAEEEKDEAYHKLLSDLAVQLEEGTPLASAIENYIHLYNTHRYQKRLNCMTPCEYYFATAA